MEGRRLVGSRGINEAAGLPDCRGEAPERDGRGTDLRPGPCPVHPRDLDAPDLNGDRSDGDPAHQE